MAERIPLRKASAGRVANIPETDSIAVQWVRMPGIAGGGTFPDPAGTATGGGAIFTQYVKNIVELWYQDVPSLPCPVQMSLGSRKVGWVTCLGNAVTITSHGMGAVVTGTATARTVATTNLHTSLRRVGLVSAAAAGSSAGIRNNALQFCRGGISGGTPYDGGVIYRARFGLGAVQANMRWFVGLRNVAAAITNVNPSTLLNIVAFGLDSGDTTVRLLQNDGAGAATKTNTTISGVTLDSVFDVFIGSSPDSSQWSVALWRRDTQEYYEDQITLDQPAQTTLLSTEMWINNGTTAAAVAMDMCFQTVEQNL